MSAQILQLAELLSIQHPAVMKVMEACAADTEKYCKEHRQEYEILGSLSGMITEEDYECIQWIVLTECLVKYNFAALLDWKCELEDFAYCVKGLTGKRKYKLTFRTAWFDEDASLEEWCAVLNTKWLPSSVSFVHLDMDSDTYILLPVLSEQYATAKNLAKAIGQKIYLAGTKNPESTSGILHDFMQRHPYMPSASQTPAQVSCENCFADNTIPAHVTPCKLEERQLFQIFVKAQKFSPKQILTISKHFRMRAMEVRKRLSMKKDLYVKAYLKDTLLTIKELEKHQIAYEILPHSPAYPHFHDCLKKILQSDGNDYKYFLFDREREKEWDERG